MRRWLSAFAVLAFHPVAFAGDKNRGGDQYGFGGHGGGDDSHGDGNEHWVGTWTTALQTPAANTTQVFSNQTLRQVVRTSIGGDKVRVRLTNALGNDTLLIGAAHIALRAPCDVRPYRPYHANVNVLLRAHAPRWKAPPSSQARTGQLLFGGRSLHYHPTRRDGAERSREPRRAGTRGPGDQHLPAQSPAAPRTITSISPITRHGSCVPDELRLCGGRLHRGRILLADSLRRP